MIKIAGRYYEKAGDFYRSTEWRKLRADVLAMDHYECQQCKAEGKYSKAQTVHHVHHLKDRPDLAMTVWYKGKRQLVSLCYTCHNRAHPEKKPWWLKTWKEKKPLTEERW